ncbi:MAG: flavin reductase family protein [Nitrososphaerales archaeon]|jgi:flavin reductase (DIM6/NTAB) family NADH-FMN oxidoreductase RutF
MRKVEGSNVYRLLYPSVPVVVAASHRGKISAMPAVSVISLSNSPTLIGVSSSPSNDTRGTIVKARCFSLSWLDVRYASAVVGLGTVTGAGTPDKLRSAGLDHSLRGSPAIPVLKDASAYLACALSKVERFGDHDLLVGEVREARAIDDFEDYWAFKQYRPILYTGSRRPVERAPVRSDNPD